ncbi:hypothetical protein DFH07DRAFT_775647 [Mycena maculata]|uniref:Uncharacterized protein n=1 Tax=Mycena maculata TaxID=230809 RepID=A0AAD7ISH8_9AGAR|nr:hypothetical protein DFH07DRAFT_775647 [Mycena maculata]
MSDSDSELSSESDSSGATALVAADICCIHGRESISGYEEENETYLVLAIAYPPPPALCSHCQHSPGRHSQLLDAKGGRGARGLGDVCCLAMDVWQSLHACLSRVASRLSPPPAPVTPRTIFTPGAQETQHSSAAYAPNSGFESRSDKLVAEGKKEQKTWVVISPDTRSHPWSPQAQPASFPFTAAAPPQTPSPRLPVLSLLSPLVTGPTSPASPSLASPKSVAQSQENALTFEGSLSPRPSPQGPGRPSYPPQLQLWSHLRPQSLQKNPNQALLLRCLQCLPGRKFAPAPDGGDDGDGGDEDGEYVAEARGGSYATATPVERSVQEMRDNLEQEEQQNDGGMDIDRPGREQGADQGGDEWITNNAPPSICARAAKLVVKLSLLTTSPERQSDLIGLLLSLTPLPEPSSNLGVPQSRDSQVHVHLGIAELASRCRKADRNIVLGDFEQMISYMELALHIQWARKCSFLNKPSMAQLAAECNNSAVNKRQLQKWLGHGSRLLYLAASGISSSSYFLPRISSHHVHHSHDCSGWMQIGNLQSPEARHRRIGFCATSARALTWVVSQWIMDPSTIRADTGGLIRHQIIPQIALLKCWASNLESSHFRLLFPPPIQHRGSEPSGVQSYISFEDLDSIQQRLNQFEFNYFQVAPADLAWDIIAQTQVALPIPKETQLMTMANESCILCSTLKKTPCPVTLGTTKAWTAIQREKASVAIEVLSIDDLKDKLRSFYAGGVRKDDTYLLIDTDICEGKVLHLRGANNKFLCFAATNLQDYLPHPDTFVNQLSSVMTGEVFKDISGRIDFTYLAWHCSFYNRYAEKGHTAPKDVHANFVKKRGKNRIKKLLPDEHREIKIFVTKLPLNEWSAAYPFGGFVVNVSACTDGHRDGFDKLFCVVIPFGNWTGGEICLYELGLVFRLHAWNIMAFPSCEVTHFNLPFKGERLSLVLHSDKFGESWVQDLNGWFPRNEESVEAKKVAEGRE